MCVLLFTTLFFSISYFHSSVVFLALRKDMMTVHDLFVKKYQNNVTTADERYNINGRTQNRNLSTTSTNDVPHTSAEKHIELNGSVLTFTPQTTVTFSFLCLFLCRLPPLGITYCPEVNQRKVEPNKFFENGDSVSMFSSLPSEESIGFDAKRLLAYPFTITMNCTEERGKTPLRSVMKTSCSSHSHSTLSTVIEIENIGATKSSFDDFSRLLFLLGMDNFLSPRTLSHWDEVLLSNKLSTTSEMNAFFSKCELPNDLKIFLSCGQGKYSIYILFFRANIIRILY
jgi:hypothetical protein